MADERLAEAIRAALDGRLTCSVAEAAQALGIGINSAYEKIHRTGSLFGIPVLRVGRRLRVSRLGLVFWALSGTGQAGAATPARDRKEA